MKPVRVILLIIGSLVALVGFGLVGAGASLGWATATQRDDAGFFSTSSDFASPRGCPAIIFFALSTVRVATTTFMSG